MVEVFEGDDGKATIKIGGGLEDQPPEIKWIKGEVFWGKILIYSLSGFEISNI